MTLSDKTPKRGKAPPRTGGGESLNHKSTSSAKRRGLYLLNV